MAIYLKILVIRPQHFLGVEDIHIHNKLISSKLVTDHILKLSRMWLKSASCIMMATVALAYVHINLLTKISTPYSIDEIPYISKYIEGVLTFSFLSSICMIVSTFPLAYILDANNDYEVPGITKILSIGAVSVASLIGLHDFFSDAHLSMFIYISAMMMLYWILWCVAAKMSALISRLNSTRIDYLHFGVIGVVSCYYMSFEKGYAPSAESILAAIAAICVPVKIFKISLDIFIAKNS